MMASESSIKAEFRLASLTLTYKSNTIHHTKGFIYCEKAQWQKQKTG